MSGHFPDPPHFPRPALEFALIRAEVEMAVKRALEKTPGIPAAEHLKFMIQVDRELQVSPLNPEAREAKSS